MELEITCAVLGSRLYIYIFDACTIKTVGTFQRGHKE
jgi:hypothetical protein